MRVECGMGSLHSTKGWRDLNRELRALYLATATNFLALTMTRPLVPLYATQLGAGPAVVGLVVAAFAALPLFAAVPAGWLTDRLGARAMVMGGALGCVAASLVVGCFPSLATLTLSQGVMGIAQLAVVVASQTQAGSVAAGKEREQALGWLTTANSLGQLFGPLLGGIIADATSYPTAFLASGALGALAPVAARSLPARPRASQSGRRAASRAEVRRLLGTGGVKAGILSSFAVLFTVGVRQAFFPLYVQSLGYAASAVGGLLSVHALASVAVRPFMPAVIAAAGGRFPTLVGSMSLLALGVVSIPFTTNLYTLALTSLLVGLGIGLCQPVSMLTVADSVSAEIRGLAMGIRLTGNRLAQLVNPIFFGAVTSVWGLNVAFIFGGCLLFATTGFLFRWRSHFQSGSAAGAGGPVEPPRRSVGAPPQ